MVYYFSLAGDQERINCLRPEDEIADLPNWFACGEFDNMEAAEQALFPLGLFDAQGCANYKLADGTPALRTEAEKAEETAARPAQCLMGGGCHNVGIGHGIRVQTCRNKSRNMSHINHKVRSDLVCNLTEFFKVDCARIRRSTCKNESGLMFKRKSAHLVKIYLLRLIRHTIGYNIKIIPRNIYG